MEIYIIPSTVGRVIWKKRKWVCGGVCMYVAGQRSKAKKTFSLIFLLSRSISKKHGLDRVQRSKKHFLPGSKVKKTFSLIFPFSRSMSKKHGLDRVQRSKEHFLPGSKVKRTLPSGFKGRKNIFFDFSTFAFYVEKHGLGRVQRSKKHSLWFFYFHVLCRKIRVLVGIKREKTWFSSGFKGQKNTFYFGLSIEKTWFSSGFKGQKNIFYFGSSIEKTWTVLVQRSAVQKWPEVLGVKEFVSTGAFVKHELKGVLKYTGKILGPPPSPFSDRQWRTMGIIVYELLTLWVPAGVIFARSAVYVYSDKKRPVLQGLIPSTVGRVIWKKKFVCLSVSGSKVKGRISERMSIETRRCYAFVQDSIDRKVNQSGVFVLWLSSNQILRCWEFGQSHVFCHLSPVQSDSFDVGKLANHMLLPFIFRRTRFFDVGSSANHAFSSIYASDQSDYSIS